MAPVHFAARYGTETEETKETIDFLMNQMDNPHLQDEFGNTVLHHSILNAGEVRDELVDHLTVKEYKRGVIIKVEYDFKRLREICNFERNDCLHIASEKGHEKVVNIILRKGQP